MNLRKSKKLKQKKLNFLKYLEQFTIRIKSKTGVITEHDKIKSGFGNVLFQFWHNKSDDDCIALATNENGLDAEQALMNMMERDFVTEMNNNIFENFSK